MTAYERAMNKADKLLEKTRKEYSEIQNSIGEYKIKQANAVAAMEKAEASCNLEEYTAARTARIESEAALEMYTKRAKKLEEETLINEEEYNKMVSEIVEEFDKYIEDMKGDLYDITTQLVNKYEAAHAFLKASNEALHALQFDLYRGHDLEYLNNDRVNDRSKKTVGTRAQFEVMNWANSISKYIYEDMKKERGQ